MWRAHVIEKIIEGRVIVVIPALYGDSAVGPMQCAVDAEPGDRVVVTDLTPRAKTRDWWVVGFESTIGRWGNPYPHEHPIGQVTGLTDALAGKSDAEHTHAQADVTGLPEIAADIAAATYLATGGTLARRFDNGGFRVVTGTNPQDAVNVEHVSTNYVTKTSYNSGMSSKADAPTDWVNASMSSYLTLETGNPIRVRNTPMGIQIASGRVRINSSIPLDATLFTIPSGYRPPVGTLIVVPGMAASGNAATIVQMEARTDGRVTMRHANSENPLMVFHETIPY